MILSPLSYKDFTIKARIANSADIELRLIQLNAEFVGTDHQTDRYYETAKGKLKWRKATIENLITHYQRFHESGFEKTIVYRYDLNPTNEEIVELQRTNKLIGVVKKQRKIYQLNHIKIHLDLLPNNEEFIELEAIDRNNRYTENELKAHCLELKAQLNIQYKDLIPTGYMNDSKS